MITAEKPSTINELSVAMGKTGMRINRIKGYSTPDATVTFEVIASDSQISNVERNTWYPLVEAKKLVELGDRDMYDLVMSKYKILSFEDAPTTDVVQ